MDNSDLMDHIKIKKTFNMENIVISSFRNLQDATLGLSKLKDLDQLNDITIYNMVMIRKPAEGKFEFLYHEGPDTQDIPATGALAGTLIGALGGPIGMAVGMVTGVMIGSANERDSEDMSREFLDDVNKTLEIGSVAIVLDVEEEDEFMINSYLTPFNGVVVRRDIADEFAKYDQEQWTELQAEIDAEEGRLKEAGEKDKAAIEAKIAKLKTEKEEKIKKIRERNAKTKEQLHNKIKALDDKWKTSDEQLKTRIAAQKEKVRKKLEKVGEDIGSAFV
jgi:uncharacterized membrane protein